MCLLTLSRFDDCLRLGKRIDEAPYILPDPEIHRLRFGEKIPDASRPDLQGATSAHPARLPNSRSSPSRDRQRLSIFESKHIMLSSDLEIANHLRETIEGLIRSGGGKVVTNIDEADILICQYRESKIFKLAWQASKTIGNLSWLYFLITHNRWTSPLKRLLHYPIARKGLPKCKDLRISLSNYNGEARTYLENLARAAGCEFTKTMKMDNTHLIAAHIFSEKCEAAKEWNINIVNHLWLEDSYAKWEIQSLSNPKYTHFPPRTNLSEVVGQTTIDLNAIARHFLPEPTVTSSELQRSAVSSVMNGGRTEKCQTINKILESSAVQPSSSIVDGLGQHPKWIDAVTMTPRASKQIGGQISEIISKTPAGSSSREKGKENETPSTSSSRGAKDRAVVKLHNLAPDIALYEKEKKRIGGVIFGGRRTSEEKSLELRHKRSMSKDDDSMVDGRDATRVTKRARKGKSPPKMRLLITGYNNWVGDLKKENEGRVSKTVWSTVSSNMSKLQLRELGILITPDPTHCTHLAAPRILRTPNFLCAMANAPILLSTRFVDECLAQNSLLRPEDYKLKDPEGEKRHEVRLIDVAERAKANKGRLLRNCYIYCTENVHGGFEAYKSIVDVNGGSCLLYRARGGSLTISKFADNDGSAEGSESGQFDYVYLITATTHVDAKLWPKFRLMAKKAGKTPRIVRNDWLLDLALTQQIRWLDKYEVTEDSVVQES